VLPRIRKFPQPQLKPLAKKRPVVPLVLMKEQWLEEIQYERAK
jgi:hypothetical protein